MHVLERWPAARVEEYAVYYDVLAEERANAEAGVTPDRAAALEAELAADAVEADD